MREMFKADAFSCRIEKVQVRKQTEKFVYLDSGHTRYAIQSQHQRFCFTEDEAREYIIQHWKNRLSDAVKHVEYITQRYDEALEKFS